MSAREWYSKLPTFTKVYFTGTLVIGLGLFFNLIDVQSVFMDYTLVYEEQ